ncbi:terminase large subunit [Falsirhodobacter halotolerans]|uniref:terminase large subunit n=1 Tax=Falsirhodobacter halotolerans TaxID=1146892 RepID=UPI001FD1475E|nr:terminase large subunit [Falsirhodobacter halotolerans]MCJ8138423.1 terminase large subunit [Falsirhodobacter halotolerans]
MTAPIRSTAWSTAVPDWKERIRKGRSLIPDLPLHDAVAEKALRIFKRLRVPDIIGTPTYGDSCGEWVFDLVRVIFGSYDPETKRRALREFFLLIPKKNGKSSIAAAIIVTAAILNERPEAELLLIAPTQKIAGIAYKQAKGIIALDDDLAKLFHVQNHLMTITHRNTGAMILVKAASPDVITGSKSTFILIDETHVFAQMAKASEVFVEIRGALAARPDGFLLQITTQSKKPPAGVFKAELTKAREVRDGVRAFPMLAVLYELPPEDANDGGWKKPENWGRVNPHLGRSVDPEWLRDEVETAELEGPEKLALIASQHFNVEIGLGLHADRWPGAIYWREAALEKMTLDRLIDSCDVATVGIDGGGLDDLMALAVIGRHRKSRAWIHWARAWAQPDVLERRKEIVPRLRDFERDGDLVFCQSSEQQEAEVADICEKLFLAGVLPEANGIGLDSAGIATLLDALASRGMDQPLVTAVTQGWKLQAAVLTLPRKLKDKTMRTSGQPLMDWAVGNAKVELRGSNYLITKQASGAAKIDPLMATFNAAMLMFLNPQAKPSLDEFLNDPIMVV